MGFADILRFISVLITVYTLLVSIRILMFWFNGLHIGKAGDYLCMITDPYLARFRTLKFLIIGGMDFTPLAALFVLAMASNLLNMAAASLSTGQPLSLSVIIILALSFLWGSVFWILLFFLVLCLIRSASLFLSRNPMGGRWSMMDFFIGPIVHTIEKKITRLIRRSFTYFQVLLVSMGLIVAVMFFGGYLVSLLAFAIGGLKI